MDSPRPMEPPPPPPMAEGVPPPPGLTELLSEELLHQVLGHLPLLVDLRSCTAVSGALRRPARAQLSELACLTRGHCDEAVQTGAYAAGELRSVPGLVTANLSGADWVTKDVLHTLATCCPRLTTLDLSRIQGLDQDAVLALRGSSSLVTVDLTFCPEIRYTAAARLRQGIPTLKTVRRLPEWLTGVFQCPFGEPPEKHSYFADGSFSFTRDAQSKGAVHNIEECDDEGSFLKDSLVYTPGIQGHPGPQQGVFLRAVERGELPEAERWVVGERGQVLVAQSLDYGQELEVFPDFLAAQVPLTDSVHVATPRAGGGEVMAILSRMVVHNLPGDGQPPKELRDELDHAAIMEDAFEPEVRAAATPAAAIAGAIAMAMQQMHMGTGQLGERAEDY